MTSQSGWHFLQIPGPSNLPERVLRATGRPTVDHRGPEFLSLAKEVIAGLKRVVGTAEGLALYPATATGAFEAALVNTLSPGDKVLAFETGHFARRWRDQAAGLGLDVDFVPDDWRHAIDPAKVEARLTADAAHAIKAVIAIHNDTSTGVASDIPGIRRAMDRARHPALLIVEAVCSLGTVEYRHDAWGVDVTVGATEKALMLPAGLAFNAMSRKAMTASGAARLPRGYFDWAPLVEAGETGVFPYTPAINLVFGAREALAMLDEEGLPQVYRRHQRLAEATRCAAHGWGLDIVSMDPAYRSNAVTAIFMPPGLSARALRRAVLERHNLSIGGGLGQFADSTFRIGHLGWLNDLMLLGALAGVEMGLRGAGVASAHGGVAAAMDYLSAAVPA